MTFNPQQLSAWITTANALIGAGITTAAGVKALIAQIHGTAHSEQDLNDICDQVLADASVRKTIADRDAGDDDGA